MIIAWDNKADAAAVTAGSEVTTLPGSNVKTQHLSQKWNTVAGVKSSYLLFDMLSAVACALLAVLGTNLTSAATMRLRASNTDSTAVAGDLLDTGTIAAGVKTGYGAIYKSFNSVTARYWRLDLTDASLPDNLQVGRVFLGPSWSHTDKLTYGWSVTPVDASVIDESYGGQEYADQRPQRRQLDFTLDWGTEANMYGNAFAMARANGIVLDAVALQDINSAYLSEQAVWGRVTAWMPLIHRATRIFTQKFTIRERL